MRPGRCAGRPDPCRSGPIKRRIDPAGETDGDAAEVVRLLVSRASRHYRSGHASPRRPAGCPPGTGRAGRACRTAAPKGLAPHPLVPGTVRPRPTGAPAPRADAGGPPGRPPMIIGPRWPTARDPRVLRPFPAGPAGTRRPPPRVPGPGGPPFPRLHLGRSGRVPSGGAHRGHPRPVARARAETPCSRSLAPDPRRHPSARSTCRPAPGGPGQTGTGGRHRPGPGPAGRRRSCRGAPPGPADGFVWAVRAAPSRPNGPDVEPDTYQTHIEGRDG